MAYATPEQFTEAFPNEVVELTNLDDPTAESTDAPELQQALDAASAEINLYLQSRYALPLDPESIPLVLVQWCRDITRYRLDRNQPAEDVRDRYEDAIQGLHKIAAGEMDLFPSSGSGGAQAIGRDRVWDGQNLSGFGVS